MSADDKVGRYVRYRNGLRCRVVGRDPRYEGDFVLESPDGGRRWHATEQTVAESEVISREEAERRWAEVAHDLPQHGICQCCSWRVGRPNVSVALPLAGGAMPADECFRLGDETREFFLKHGLAPRVHGTPEGVRLEFISIAEGGQGGDATEHQRVV